jgi:hypothetical protein
MNAVSMTQDEQKVWQRCYDFSFSTAIANCRENFTLRTFVEDPVTAQSFNMFTQLLLHKIAWEYVRPVRSNM